MKIPSELKKVPAVQRWEKQIEKSKRRKGVRARGKNPKRDSGSEGGHKA